jgi:multisubunit Na+/H+ antiporter MnhB subunit
LTRRKSLGLVICILTLILVFSVYNDDIKSVSSELYDHYTTMYSEETGADNMVTAIYLNYRFPDTLFETLTLLISVIGIISFSRHSLGED